jgi:hypothetical protein
MTAASPAVRATVSRLGSWVPSWPLIAAKFLELRKRRALMIVTLLFTAGLPVLILGFRLVFHAIDPKTYSPAGSPAIFTGLGALIAVFGFIIAVTIGATAGTTDLTDGVFRYLVITGRSRLALFLARVPAGLGILLSLAGAGFAIVCLVTAFLGTPQPRGVSEGPASSVLVPASLSQPQLQTWIIDHPREAGIAFGPGPESLAGARAMVHNQLTDIYSQYTYDEASQLTPSAATMTGAGLWIELGLLAGFTVGLGLGSLMGQRTLPVILLTVLDIIITPALAAHALPFFINGERLDVGIAIDQIQPPVLGGGGGAIAGHLVGRPGGGPAILPALAMPTWALITVIAGWIIGWSVLGAWRMATRDA